MLNGKGGIGRSGTFRLPAEAEWEYACRAGTTGRFPFDGGISQLAAHAWYNKNAQGQSRQVGQRQSNPWGLCDMLGNVWEWCEDWYAAYPGAETSNKFMGREMRVLRGGSYVGNSTQLSCSGRSGGIPDERSKGVGFRVVLEGK
jgi:formylglycine-generating enzyme required for sulfatase activity